jgi:hypothetical protein
MTVKLRLSGEPEELARVLDALGQLLDVATDRRTYPQRGGFGVRCYAEARLRPATTDRVPPGNPAGDSPNGQHTSPLAAAEDAKSRRDLAGEIGALPAADAQLRAQTWHPLQPGDVVLTHTAFPDGFRHGETYVAVDPAAGTEATKRELYVRLTSGRTSAWCRCQRTCGVLLAFVDAGLEGELARHFS